MDRSKQSCCVFKQWSKQLLSEEIQLQKQCVVRCRLGECYSYRCTEQEFLGQHR